MIISKLLCCFRNVKDKNFESYSQRLNKPGTNAHLRSIHSFVNNSVHDVVAVRVWSGKFFIQDLLTHAPENKPFRLINLPFYYLCQLDRVLEHF